MKRSQETSGRSTTRSRRQNICGLGKQAFVLLFVFTLYGCGPDDARDELLSQKTLHGTPVTQRGIKASGDDPKEVMDKLVATFPAEPRDLLWQMDQVWDPKEGKLEPIDFDENGDGVVDNEERNAIRGRNTWLVWGAGDEVFWNWLQQEGYGLTDLMILLDSRQRDTRFKRTGLINQPGFKSTTEKQKKILGLYLDQEQKPGSALLKPYDPNREADSETNRYKPYDASTNAQAYQPSTQYDPYQSEAEAERYDARGRELREPVPRPVHSGQYPTPLFTPWKTEKEADPSNPKPFDNYIPDRVRKQLVQDGFDPSVYGYPSGIFGLRLFLNPDFFANTEAAEEARKYWKQKVEDTNDRYYIDSTLSSDPSLVRPFRVSMSCGFCHIGPHPLNPPADPEHPEWENLSGIIGGQYWDPQPAFATLLQRSNFLYHFLRSQAPGTIDTSLVSTDQINNTNVINAVFDVPARLKRALEKPTERQSDANLLLRSLEDNGSTSKDRHFATVLFPGEDSVGVFGALARVPLNIGLFGEQWLRIDNPVIGFTPQRPFSVASNLSNSVNWNVNDRYRVKYMADFFQVGSKGIRPKSTAPMLLRHAGDAGIAELGPDDERRRNGREVFIDHCAICHSSKQPRGFDLGFSRKIDVEWDKAPVPGDGPARLHYTLPSDYADWEKFKRSPAYHDYVRQLRQIDDLLKPAPDGSIEATDPFLKDNYLSNELRVPITLVGTYSGRAMATNAMSGQVWDNFSSDSFKALPSVGAIRYYNPYSTAAAIDEYGNNATYSDGRTMGGPGYLRPPSLISVWATAPYFHNNELGIYTHDPSVKGRLEAFHDGIRKLLWNKERASKPGDPYRRPGDLRSDDDTSGKGGVPQPAAGDPGFIYRLPNDSEISFAPPFIRPLIVGILSGYLGRVGGCIAFGFLSWGLWLALAAFFVVGVMRGRARHVGILVLSLAIVLAVVLGVTGAGGYGGTTAGAIMMLGAETLLSMSSLWLWVAVGVLLVVGLWLLLTSQEWRVFTRGVFATLSVATLAAGIFVHGFLNGQYDGIKIGPLPRGTPVNLLMNIDPEKTDKLPAAIVALVRGMSEVRKQGLTGDKAYKVFSDIAGAPLMAASKVPDFVVDRGHYFGEKLSDDQKNALIAFLETI